MLPPFSRFCAKAGQPSRPRTCYTCGVYGGITHLSDFPEIHGGPELAQKRNSGPLRLCSPPLLRGARARTGRYAIAWDRTSSPSNGVSSHKGNIHIYALVMNGIYPQIIHNMWGLISAKGQDVAGVEGWSKVRWKYRGEGGAGECQSSGSRTGPEAGGGNSLGPGLSNYRVLHVQLLLLRQNVSCLSAGRWLGSGPTTSRKGTGSGPSSYVTFT